MSIIDSGSLTVANFLQKNIYHIPEYQRGYSWTEAQLEDLWIDLMQLFNDVEQSTHFLGQVVVHFDRQENKRYIIDGQQRTSTIVIFLDALRNILDKLHDKYNIEDAGIDAVDITTIFIGRVTTKRQTERLILGETDREFYKNLIQKRGTSFRDELNPKSLINSEKLIYQASNYYQSKLNELIESNHQFEDTYQLISDLLDLILNKFQLMYVETDDINEAFIIFETLNARGKDLETSDLLKNHVFRSSSNKLDSIKQKWYQIIENLGNIDPTKFIRHYWNSQYKFVREKDLYKSIRRKVDTPKKVEELVDDLVQLSELYTSLNSPETNIYFQENKLVEKTQEIKSLGASSYLPIILALEKERYSEKDIYDVFESIEFLIVRNFIVAGKVANRYEIEFAKIAYKISQHSFKNVEEIINSIKTLTINDDEFYDDFKIFTTKKTPVVRYLLRKIHSQFDKETKIIQDNNAVHIEHIMPKKAGDWIIDEETHKEYLWRLGNLTLLGQEYNRSATNKTFDKKKEVYMNSNIPMTKQLIDFDSWEIKDIEKRQEKFAKLALDIWAI